MRIHCRERSPSVMRPRCTRSRFVVRRVRATTRPRILWPGGADLRNVGCAADGEARPPAEPSRGTGRSRPEEPEWPRTAGCAGLRELKTLWGAAFQNPVLLAAGTAGFGREIDGVMDLDRLGGIVTKAVTPEPRRGHPGPRVAEFRGGMLNAIGLANPGLEDVAAHDLPWLFNRVTRARVLVNVTGATVEDY